MGKQEALIVGGGVSGLLAALILAKNRYRVVILEKEDWIGGACRSYEIDGYVVDTGPHVITHLKNGPLAQIMRRYFNLIPNFVEHGNYHIRRHDGVLKKLPLDIIEFLSTDIIPKKDKPKIAVALTEGLTKMMVDSSKMNISLWEYVKKYNLSKETLKLLDAIAYFLAGVSMKECPAWRFFTGSGYWSDDNPMLGVKDQITKRVSYIRRAIIHDRFPDQGYPMGGIRSIIEAITYSMKRCDVVINTSERVEKINVDANKVISVESDKNEYEPDVVVYAAELTLLPKLMDHVPDEHMNKIRTLKDTRAITVWIGFKDRKGLFDYKGSEIYYEGKAPFWAVCTSNFDPSLAPEGRRLVGFGSVIKIKNERRYEKLLVDEILSIFEGIEKDVELLHTQILRPEKAAVRVGAVFPGVSSGISNLFCVGTDTDPRSMGVTRAAYSVIEMAKLMKIWH